MLFFAGRLRCASGYQRHFPVVVDEADSCEALVRHAAVQLKVLQIAHVDRLFGEFFVETDERTARLRGESAGCANRQVRSRSVQDETYCVG